MSRRPTRREYKPPIDMFTIMKYCALFTVFALVIFGVNKIVLTAIDMSPTQQVGNGGGCIMMNLCLLYIKTIH